MRKVIASALLLATLVATGGAHAQTVAPEAPAEPAASATADAVAATRVRYAPIVDIPVTLLAGAIAVAPRVFGHEEAGPPRGDPSNVFVLDRFVARSPETRASARTASDVVLFSSLALGAAASMWSFGDHAGTRIERRRERLRRLGVFVETILTTNALTTIVKLGADRPRPFTYAASYDPANGSRDDRASFFSGHASTVAAASSAAAYFAFVDSSRDARRYAIVAAGGVASLGVATLRVRAGRHFPTDVATGVLVGACVGILVPHLHRRTGLALDVATVRGGGVITLAGRLDRRTP